MVTLNKTTTFAVRGQVDRAVAEVRLLQMPAWPQWALYLVERLESEAAELGAEPDEIREMLETVRASLDDRLASGKWQPV